MEDGVRARTCRCGCAASRCVIMWLQHRRPSTQQAVGGSPQRRATSPQRNPRPQQLSSISGGQGAVDSATAADGVHSYLPLLAWLTCSSGTAYFSDRRCMSSACCVSEAPDDGLQNGIPRVDPTSEEYVPAETSSFSHPARPKHLASKGWFQEQ